MFVSTRFFHDTLELFYTVVLYKVLVSELMHNRPSLGFKFFHEYCVKRLRDFIRPQQTACVWLSFSMKNETFFCESTACDDVTPSVAAKSKVGSEGAVHI